MRRALLPLVLLVLPGCVTTGPDSQEGAALGGGDGTLPWALTGCTYLVAVVPVPSERLAPHVPEGFTLSPRGSPVAAVEGDAYLGVEAFQCASGVGADGSEIAPMEYGSFFTSVEPPADLAVTDVDAIFLKWDVLVPDAPRRDALVEAGMPARAGSARVERPADPLPRVVGTLTLEGVGTFTVDGAVQQPGGLPEGRFVEFMPRGDGEIGAWSADWTTESLESGRAVVTFEPGSWPAEVAGERAAATFITGTWSFSNGTIALSAPRSA